MVMVWQTQTSIASTMPSTQGEKIGKGACGIVSVCNFYNQFNEAPLVQKACCNPGTCGAHLDNEAEILSKLRHENIVKFVSYDQKGKKLYLEFIKGTTLAQKLESGTLTEDAAKQYLHQLLSAVYYLQIRNIAHLDIKAENIMITNDNVLKLIDFGLAENLGPNNIKEKVCCGTPDYIAPEVFHEHTCSLKADMWSIGILLFKCLTGDFPFARPTLMETREAIKTEDFCTRQPQNNLQLSADCYSLLSALLSRNPEDRPSAEKVLQHPWFTVSVLGAPHTPTYNARSEVRSIPFPHFPFHLKASPISLPSPPYGSPFVSPVGSPTTPTVLSSSLPTVDEYDFDENCAA